MSSFGSSGSFVITQVTNTLPAVPRGPRRFGFIADQGEVTPHRDAIAEQIKNQCELVVLGGDQNYGGSAGAVVANNAIWSGITQRAVIGNHDVDFGDNGAAHNAHFTGRPASPVGLPHCYHETILGGLVDLIVLDSGRDSAWTSTVTGGVAVGSPMHTWVSGLTLTAPHRVFAFHHPPFGPVNAANRYVTDLAWDWRALGATVVLCGHTHMGWTGVKGGVRFICAGNGGRREASLSATLHGSTTKNGLLDAFLEWASEEDYTGCILTATASDLSFQFIDQYGRTLHGASCYAFEQDSTSNTFEVIPPTGSITNGTHLVTRAGGGFHVTGVSFHAGEAVSGAEARLTVNGVALTAWHPTGLTYDVIPVLPAWMGALVLPGQSILCEVRNVPVVEYPPLGGFSVGMRQAFVV